jgi:hypothetical protein
MLRINYLAVLVSALVYWVLGALWYSPLLFARPFIALMRWTPEDLARIERQGAAREIVIALASSLLTAYVLAHFVRLARAQTVADGLKTAFWAFVGFALTTNLSTVLFEGRPFGLYLINNGYNLVGFLLMGAVLAAWRKQEALEPAYQS